MEAAAMAADSIVAGMSGVQVCIRARPLNARERDEGCRMCISFEDTTKQVVLEAVDKATLAHLHGAAAKAFAFDRYYGPNDGGGGSDRIYDDAVAPLVDALFKGYNGTVLAYGQTGSGKTLTMAGGVGSGGRPEPGIMRRAAEHVARAASALRAEAAPGESVELTASAFELYNEELRDLGRAAAAAARAAKGGGGSGSSSSSSASMTVTASASCCEGAVSASGDSQLLRISERPGRDGRVVPHVAGAHAQPVADADALAAFFAAAAAARAVGATLLNDRSSRGHAIYTIALRRTTLDVSTAAGTTAGTVGTVRTVVTEAKLHLVDLAGSERVKRSGAEGTRLREAAHINGALLALGNVIVALSPGGGAGGGAAAPATTAAAAKKVAAPSPTPPSPSSSASPSPPSRHVPYRDSKLTRLLQDSLGGSGLTVLVACVSGCEADFEESANTLKYARRACSIKNAPLPSKYVAGEEELLLGGGGCMAGMPLLGLPAAAGGAGGGTQHLGALLAEHARAKEARVRADAERRERERGEARAGLLRAAADAALPGGAPAAGGMAGSGVASATGASRAVGAYQRLRMGAYDEMRRKLVSRAAGGGELAPSEAVAGDLLVGLRRCGSAGADLSGGSSDEDEDGGRRRRGGGGRRTLLLTAPLPVLTSRPPSSSSLLRSGGTTPAALQRAYLGGGSCSVSSSRTGTPRGSRPATATAATPRPGSAAAPARPHSRARTPSMTMARGAGGAAAGIAAAAAPLRSRTPDVLSTAAAVVRPLESEAAAAAPCAKTDQAAVVAEQEEGGCCCCCTAKEQQGVETIAAFRPASADAADDGAEVASASAGAADKEEEKEEELEVDRRCSSSSAAAAVSDEESSGAEAAPSPSPSLLPSSDGSATDAPATTTVAAADAAPLASEPSAISVTTSSAEEQQQEEEQQASTSTLGDAASGSDGGRAVVLSRFRINARDVVAVTLADADADLDDVAALLPPGSALPDGDSGVMTYLIARLEASGTTAAAGPAVGCLMATFGTSLVADCIFDFDDPEELSEVPTEARLELWGLQIPTSTSARPALGDDAGVCAAGSVSSSCGSTEEEAPAPWSAADRLNVSLGLLHALCAAARAAGARAGFCAPRSALLRRWLQAGVAMRQVPAPARLVYPPSAPDYATYRAATAAYFHVDEIAASVERVLCVVPVGGGGLQP